MEQERFEFSPMKPILLVILVPAVYTVFSRYVTSYTKYKEWFNANDWVHIAILMLVVLYLVKPLRITILMLMMRPAVVLTNECIRITYTGYTIYWTDVKDVYLGSSGSGTRGPVSYYVIIKVRDPEKYLAKIRNPLNRWYQRITRKLRPSPFEIELSLVRGDEDEILRTVLKYYQNNRGF